MAIQKADAEFRRKVLLWLGLAIAVALAAMQWGLPKFKTFLLEKDPAHALKLIIPLLYTMLLGLLLAMMPLLTLIKRTLESGRFPPPETKLIRDVPVLEGEPALQKARQLKRLLLLVIGLLMFSTLFTHWILVRLVG